MCALAVTVSPIELDHFGEYLALARGLRTYALPRRFSVSGAPRWERDPRAQWQIANPHRRYAVVPQHNCGVIPHCVDGVLSTMKRPSADYHGPPPF